MPNLKYVSYSTCSIFQEENEDVVEKVLEEYTGTVKVIDISVPQYHTGWTAGAKGTVRVCPKC